MIEFKRCVMPFGAPLLRLATRELPVIPPEARAYFVSWLITTPRLGSRGVIR